MNRMSTKGRSLFFALMIVMTIPWTTGHSAESQTAVTGELVETYCWASLRIGGPAHAACAIECAKRGIPVALHDRKQRQTYVLLPGRDKASLPPQLIAAMGRNVTVQGTVIVRDRNQFLTVQSWTLAR